MDNEGPRHLGHGVSKIVELVRFGLEHQELVLDGEDEDVGGPAREAEHDRPAAKNVSLK